MANEFLEAPPSSIALGALMLLTGGLSLLPVLNEAHRLFGRYWQIAGCAYLLAAAAAFADPSFEARALTLLLAGCLAISGGARLSAAISWRGYGFGWPLMSGLASLAFAATLANDWPEPARKLLGLVLAIDMLVQGIMLMLLANSSRKMAIP
ncbi:hypothetical protein M527_04645 [Sphingobium indicum IP26]|uniref:Uncharacterized protein n=2 Tax=Sphingobium indicum TaxID=332055 RepID=A0A8E0WVB5_9SPHN|nr:hypothetical protein M527_02760 [Sphingobium indicum IP26]EPR11376.1 hypothetical protein M527_04645 [Sphingobium indicum IP26]KER38147.1 hypothetical protein AL00_02120 [Sphingobium indicum F2]